MAFASMTLLFALVMLVIYLVIQSGPRDPWGNA